MILYYLADGNIIRIFLPVQETIDYDNNQSHLKERDSYLNILNFGIPTQ